MTAVWIAFLATSVALAGGAWVVWRRASAPLSRILGGFLLAMALGTALFPALLPVLGTGFWVWGYIAFVVDLTIVMTGILVVKARRTAPGP